MKKTVTRSSIRPTIAWVFALTASVTGLALTLIAGRLASQTMETIVFPLIFVSFSTTGFFLYRKRPGHRMAILYLSSGVLGGLYWLVVTYWTAGRIQGWPGTHAMWLGEQLVYFPWVLSMVALPIMLFPTGRLPTPRWNWVKWVGAALLFFLLVPFVIFPESPNPGIGSLLVVDADVITETVNGQVPLTETDVTRTPGGDLLWSDGTFAYVTESHPDELTFGGGFTNPLAIDTLAPLADLDVIFGGGVFLLLVVVVLATAPAALIVRFRRSEGIERQQLKWLVYPAAVAGIGLILVYALDEVFGAFDTWWIQSLIAISLLAVLMIPVATGMAIVRYRLYDIDRLISRTVLYGVLVALLAGTYLGVVFLLSQFVPDENSIAVAIATLAVAGLFNPLRGRIQDLIDRRLYRSQYNAREIVEDFSGRLTDEVDIQTLEDELLDVVDETVKPETAAVWIRSQN